MKTQYTIHNQRAAFKYEQARQRRLFQRPTPKVSVRLPFNDYRFGKTIRACRPDVLRRLTLGEDGQLYIRSHGHRFPVEAYVYKHGVSGHKNLIHWRVKEQIVTL
jgi:hypothetical protein